MTHTIYDGSLTYVEIWYNPRTDRVTVAARIKDSDEAVYYLAGIPPTSRWWSPRSWFWGHRRALRKAVRRAQEYEVRHSVWQEILITAEARTTGAAP